MINAAVVGFGAWGRTMVESVASGSQLMRFTTVQTRTVKPEDEAFAKQHSLRMAPSYEAVLADPSIDAVVLTTPPTGHLQQIEAAAAAGKHVFCEKPFTFSKREAAQALETLRNANRVVGIGFNRRFHPEMIKLHDRVQAGELGTIQHIESNMTYPNALSLPATVWRAQNQEAPLGGFAPMGVHLIDAMTYLLGEVDRVYCQSFARVLTNGTDDTTSVLLRMKNGASGYFSTMTTTGPGFAFQVFGSKGWFCIEGSTTSPTATPADRRSSHFGSCRFQPVKGPAESWPAQRFDIVRANLEAFASAIQGGPPFPIPPEQILHGASIGEAVIRSAATGQVETVE